MWSLKRPSFEPDLKCDCMQTSDPELPHAEMGFVSVIFVSALFALKLPLVLL